MLLDKSQSQIVNSKENNIIVAAGAGSGKTRVLTERVKKLINDGTEPCNMVVITFTNMAADEMRERLIDVEGIGDAFIGTIHSFANRLMKNSGEMYELYTEEKENSFARFIIRRYCKYLTYDRFLEFKDLKYKCELGRVSEDTLNEYLLPSEKSDLVAMFGEPSNEFEQTIPSMCKMENIITFTGLLKKATNYFKNIGGNVEHVLVDELQDIGYLEYKFIKSLNAKNYFFVGDDWQAIYGFKGGDVNIFRNLIKDSKWKTYYLETNYRNSKQILDKANLVIRQISQDNLIDKKVKAFSKKEGKVEIGSRYKLKQYLSNIPKVDYRDYFLLVRTNKELYEVSHVLEEMQIPYSSFRKGQLTLAEMREELNRPTIKLLTVHTSKGLESKNVILYGHFPIKQPYYLKNEDERKVMYVGMTRAMDKLIILN